ncbi:hypothetical protein A3H78_04700 [Candidatus Roizmanbacteria bacterium RIFCSPLOWO2_02_FULL_36_11]|uniref:Uncharacterized protein n=1 Tax=Candidatus Roizmanbacteria bacterium RIFCSPLOWO2_02_FULL_36_11 TaxID=1802071 RepID=A0A1F7JD14_9BACT|nr:MAG: hypothetical protein A3H78_04700 [Candidatus Roizmanbacteria bacterium RIFCSPLOWO2_02_FULL_36_11]
MKTNFLIGLLTASVLISFVVIRNYINKPANLVPKAQSTQQCTDIARSNGYACKVKCEQERGRFVEWCTANIISPGCIRDEIEIWKMDTNDPEYHARCCKPLYPSPSISLTPPITVPITPKITDYFGPTITEVPTPTITSVVTPTSTPILTPTLTPSLTLTPTLTLIPTVTKTQDLTPTLTPPIPTNVCIVPKPRIVINCPPPCEPISTR